jgi:hypothetical protein
MKDVELIDFFFVYSFSKNLFFKCDLMIAGNCFVLLFSFPADIHTLNEKSH